MHNIEKAEAFVLERLYNPKIKLIYDYVTSREEDGAIRHLPTPEEVQNDIPNPCGWGVGMEDSMLNAGSMIEAYLAENRLTGTLEKKEIISDLFDGMVLCATVSDCKGYLARSVHPLDGKSHYSNSSRDQYTHWVFAGCRLYDSPLATDAMKEKIRQVLVSFAEKAEREVIPENNYSLLRADGKPGTCCEMYGSVGPHECMRLPMIYIGAYHVTGDAHWMAQYRKYRDWALEGSEKVDATGFPWAYCVLQMQYSLRLVWEEETEESYRARLEALMNRVAEGATVYSHKTHEVFLGEVPPRDEGNVLPEWRSFPHEYRFGKPVYGKTFFTADICSVNPQRMVLRNGAEAMIMHALCPNRPVPQDEAEKFALLAKTLDFENASNYWPVLWVDAYWLLREKGAI